ncbi:MAG: hypothetical protein KGN84_08935 [Acidobacteriota bacterium]|nr:hypothetical protein [Acidobacteriota bacterium]
MKAFRFRLNQALGWRRAQAKIAETTVQNVAARIAALQKTIEERQAEYGTEARDLAVRTSGPGIENWTAYSAQSRRSLNQARAQLKEAECELGRYMRALVEANRRVKLLENLRQSALDRWNEELARELEAFAGEAFLAGYNRQRSYNQ